VHRADRLPCRPSSSATASLAVGNDRPPDAGLPLRDGGPLALAGNSSANLRPTADRIAAVSQLAWHLISALPSSPSDTLRLALWSSWAGQRANQPSPAFFAADSLEIRILTGVIAHPPSPGQPAGSAKPADRPLDIGRSCACRCRGERT